MTKESNEYTPRLKYYHIILISIILSPLLILNSNSVNKRREQEKSLEKERKNIFLRKLDFTSDTHDICKKGTEELQKYYESGDGEIIGLNGDKIESGNNPDYINALINIISDEGDQDIMDYIMHIIPVLIFLVIAILSLPGWLVCCICSCANCCCCCCCKKAFCKLPFYIITSVVYALVFAVCIYGLSQSNSIFVGLADTECSLLKFIGEVLDGETKETKPKWIGISGIKDIFQNTKNQIEGLNENTRNNLRVNKDNVSDLLINKSKNFDKKNQELSIIDKNITDDNKYRDNLWNITLRNGAINGKYEKDGYLNVGNKYHPMFTIFKINKNIEYFSNPRYERSKTGENVNNKLYLTLNENNYNLKIKNNLNVLNTIKNLEINGKNLLDTEDKRESEIKGKKILYNKHDLDYLFFKQKDKGKNDKELHDINIKSTLDKIYEEKTYVKNYKKV